MYDSCENTILTFQQYNFAQLNLLLIGADGGHTTGIIPPVASLSVTMYSAADCQKYPKEI